MSSSTLASVEPLDPFHLSALYLMRRASSAPLLGLHSNCWVDGWRYRVVGFLDLDDGEGPRACLLRLDAYGLPAEQHG